MNTSLKNLDEYIGKFYEDNLDEKAKAAKVILDLFQNFRNLDELL